MFGRGLEAVDNEAYEVDYGEGCEGSQQSLESAAS